MSDHTSAAAAAAIPDERRLDVRRCISAPPISASARLPLAAGLATAIVALVNIASALTPEMPGRVRALLVLAPVQAVTIAQSVALPVGLALLVSAWRLALGGRAAVNVAMALLAGAGALNLLKGLDVEESILCLAVAAGLWRTRAAFHAAPRPIPARQLLTLAACVPAALGWLPTPDGLHLLALIVGTAAVAACLRPARVPSPGTSGPLDRPAASAVARHHGCGTLGAFTLRQDVQRVWAPDARAFIAYRVEAGTLLMSGDPVGDPDSHGDALDAAIALARRHGLRLGAVAAGTEFGNLARTRGLRRLYVGDEALLATGAMDLSGGARKSLRKAVNRVERGGYTATLHQVGDLDRKTIAALEAVSAAWHDGGEERGFSMGHDRLCDELLPDASVVIARDGDGEVQGFLHFVPVFGRAQVSLAFMRRARDTPNGLIDFLVVRGAALLADAGIEELSLNFAPFGSLRRNPRNAVERAVVRFLLAIDRWFGLAGLEHFNAKFDPRWEPRVLLFGAPAALPRVLLAAMICEGLIPWPRTAGAAA